MKWYLEILDFLFLASFLYGAKYFWNYGFVDWQFWVIGIPLIVVSRFGFRKIIQYDMRFKQ